MTFISSSRTTRRTQAGRDFFAASDGRNTAGPVTTSTVRSASSAVERKTCRRSAGLVSLAQVTSAPSGIHAQTASVRSGWQAKKKRPTPLSNKLPASHASKGAPMTRESIKGCGYPVFAVSSGTKMTADLPGMARTTFPSE